MNQEQPPRVWGKQLFAEYLRTNPDVLAAAERGGNISATRYRKKAGPEFDAMQFDGSHESAKAIFSWAGSGYDSQNSHWSSNQTMTFPWASTDHQHYAAGDWVIKRPGGLYRIDRDAFASDYEAVV